MAAAPSFIGTPKTWAGSVSTANTNRDGTGTIATIVTAGASGSKVEEVIIKADGDPADGIVVIYLHDGSTYFVYDEYDMGNPAAGSATVVAYRENRYYSDLVLPSGWTLRASITAAPTAGTVKVICHGGDF